MCDIHLCEKMILAIFKAGPVGLTLLPTDIILHLLNCEECAEKLGALILLESQPSVSEKVM